MKAAVIKEPIIEGERYMIRTGLAQMDIAWEDIRANKLKVRDFFKKAAEKQVDILVFPEMTLTGFSMNVKSTTRHWERQREFFRLMSKEYHIAVVCGYPSAPMVPETIRAAGSEADRAGDSQIGLCRNHLAIFCDGVLLMDYAKIHPFSYGVESEYFEGGDRVCTTGFRDTTLGGFVCYDLRFPEIFQCSSDKSEIIFVIASWPKARIGHWDILLQARAIENQCYIIGVNRTGAGGGLDYPGHSAVYSPEGQLCTPLSEDEILIFADIDPVQVRTYRNDFPTKKDRRCDLYGKLKVSS